MDGSSLWHLQNITCSSVLPLRNEWWSVSSHSAEIKCCKQLSCLLLRPATMTRALTIAQIGCKTVGSHVAGPNCLHVTFMDQVHVTVVTRPEAKASSPSVSSSMLYNSRRNTPRQLLQLRLKLPQSWRLRTCRHGTCIPTRLMIIHATAGLCLVPEHFVSGAGDCHS